ncbi:MAG: dihydrolipoamide acetyltransferase family protein [Saprospiraceae bacterium]
MTTVELVMPKMGESIMEATILTWSKQIGDSVEADETILEIATDKVDSEVPSPVDGVIKEVLFNEGDVVKVGTVIAILSTDGEGGEDDLADIPDVTETASHTAASVEKEASTANLDMSEASRFYSPLVKNIAKEEGLAISELEQIKGSGSNGRVTKQDILSYLENKSTAPKEQPTPKVQPASKTQSSPKPAAAPKMTAPPVNRSGNVEIVEMDRMRKMIADHMVMSKHVSPHVTSFVEADMTNVVNWRNKNKKAFQERYGEKITYTPIFVEAVTRAIKDFPGVNASIDGTQIILRKDINIGMAAALPTGNLIVPVIKNADFQSLAGLAKSVNDLAGRARANKLKPDDIQGGTFTLTNVGTFGNVMGTPIINQPQVAILAVGAIRKMPAVLETEYGDIIAIRQKMFLSLSYDHRVVDGMLGGSFLRRVADYLEAWDVNRAI